MMKYLLVCREVSLEHVGIKKLIKKERKNDSLVKFFS